MDILVSIIIVNFNTSLLLENCIDSVKRITVGVEYEVIVVDNDSESGSIDYLVQKYPDVQFIFSDENLGFGRANNLGEKSARGKFLFFLNPDTLLINNAVKILYDFMVANSQVGACGGNLYKADQSPAVSFHTMDFYTREWRILLNKKWSQGFNHTDQPVEVNVIMGADLFMPKILFDKIGGFDSDFFMYFEEVYLCDSIRKVGYKIMSVPQAKIIHMEGAAAENKSEDLKKWSYQEHWYSKFVYFEKTKGHFKTSVLYSANILKLQLASFVYLLKNNKEKLDYWQIKSKVLNQTYSRYKSYLRK